MVRKKGTSEEELEEWFNRMEFGLEDTTDLEHITSFMTRRAEVDGWPAPTQDQTAAMWQHVEKRYAWTEASISPFLSRTTIGAPLRFGIKGMRGAWGIDNARFVYEVRTGKKPPF